MTDDILVSIKASLGLPADYTPFDNEIILHINTILGIVNQLGIGAHDYQISEDDHGSWDDFLEEEILEDNALNEVKTYVAKRVQILFDPPTSGILMEAYNKIIAELEWRILVKKETP